MKKLIPIDDVLYSAITANAKAIGNNATKEITEMLWLALKPRTEQIKKVLALRAKTTLQINDNKETKEEQEEDFEKILETL